MQIVWKLWNSAWTDGRKPRILYLADRNILIDQPRLGYFVPAFGDGQIWTLRSDAKAGREIYFALYQALADGGEVADGLFREFGADFFDLVIVDECHRGSARATSSWRAILDHFSAATQLGMTAAGRRSTHSCRRFRRAWALFERVVSLLTRTNAAARHLTDYLKRTDRWAKTVVFCVDQEHADQMRRALHNANADIARQHPNYVVRIVSEEGEIGRGHLSDFADTESATPVIATTSQLLSTGVDLPTVRNIVLFRPVGSIAMFKQMIGRGTRVFPDEDKLSFDIIDYSGATRLFADPEFDGPPERVDEEEIDADGAVVEDHLVEEPAAVFDWPDVESAILVDDLDTEPRSKF